MAKKNGGNIMEESSSSSPTLSYPNPLSSLRSLATVMPSTNNLLAVGWKQNLVRRLEMVIDQTVEKVRPTSTPTTTSNDSPCNHYSLESDGNFFANNRPRDDFALLRRSEVCIDQYIATGSFCDVFQVSGFDLCCDTDNDMSIKPEQQMSRRRIRQLATEGKSRFVIKNVRRSLESTEEPTKHREALSSLMSEAKFLSRLDHENILKLRGCSWTSQQHHHQGAMIEEEFEDDSSFFIILDRVHATLSDRIKQWKDHKPKFVAEASDGCGYDLYYFEERLRYSLEIANALMYLHEHRIIYRDLKPTNIGITSTNCVQLFDFGFCRELPNRAYAFGETGEERYHMTCAGTRRYMAPEVVTKSGYNLKADVYSWSMVFYEMLALRQPYDDYNRDLHYLLACEEGRRPRLDDRWPMEIVRLLKGGWSHKLLDRSDMEDIVPHLSLILHKMMMLRKTATQSSIGEDGEEYHVSSSPVGSPPRSRKLSSIGLGSPFRDGASIGSDDTPCGYDHLTLTDCSSYSIESDDTLSSHHRHRHHHG